MFIEKLLQLMAEKKASDLFISAGSPICIKIQGTIMPVNPALMDGEQTKKIIYEMLNPTQQEVLTKEQELNFSKPMPGIGNFRVNCFWQKGTCGLVIRYITSDIPKMQDLNLPPVLASLIMEKRGLVLVVGATGSGKSTTLASMIDYRNMSGPGHILTMEDPVEYVFTPKKCIINQREVGNDTHSFHDALRNAMRQAPDIILIGEIRDLETMRMALTYALSGHLCLATLHANNAYQAMNRVISFFPLEVRPMLLQDLSVSLKAVMSQRLIKTLDGKRTPAVEVLLNTRNIQELIEKACAAKNGHQFSALWRGVWQGLGYASQSDADAAFFRALAEFVKVRRGAFDAAERIRSDVGADHQEIAAELPHQVELAFGAGKGAAPLRLRHALEIAERLERHDLQAERRHDAGDVLRRAVERQQIALEDLDAGEPGRRDRLELLGEPAAQGYGGDGGLHPASAVELATIGRLHRAIVAIPEGPTRSSLQPSTPARARAGKRQFASAAPRPRRL